jgi:DNA repair exonuclease SbcCD ATPase subunit
MTSVEDKLRKFEQDKTEKLARLEQKMQQLESLTKDKDFNDGPAKDLADSLAKADLKKAKEDVDELRKKAKEEKLDAKDSEKLDKQLEKMKNELERLAKNEEQEKKLQDKINKAKKEGQDAESLDRELEKMKQEHKESGKELQDLANQMQRARNALNKGDMEELAQELEKVAGQMQKIEGELKDLEDAQDYLQRLKEAKEAACKACQGDGDPEKMGDKKFAGGKGIASGERAENKDAKTASQDEKIRGLFDPRGKKVYGGSTKGQAFTKKTTVEMGKQIQEAVQEAPQAVDAQRLPRDARDTVKEYFESLGGSKKD